MMLVPQRARRFATFIERNRNGLFDLGKCAGIRVKCLSEIGWFDHKLYLAEAERQPGVDHWHLVRDRKNLAGVSSLVEIENTGGRRTTFLQDCGWNHDYMDKLYAKYGVDTMLRKRQIRFLFITHEHHDHFLGVPCVLRHFPDIPVYVPASITTNAHKYFMMDPFDTTAEPNRYQKHRGCLHLVPQDRMMRLEGLDGCGTTSFDVDLGRGQRGESAIFAQLEDKGLVIFTGCCHLGILNILDYAKKNIVGGDRVYGIYGGLHLAPKGSLLAGARETAEGLAKRGVEKVAANHCTGEPGIRALLEAGVKVAGPREGQHVGGGDSFVF